MKPNEIKDTVNQFILDELEKGVVPWHQSWNTIQISGTTGKPYQSINQLVLQIQKKNKGYKSNRWLTFKTVAGLGGRVNKGEKATIVVYWQILKREEVKADGSIEEKVIPLLKSYYVFNLDQTTLEGVADSEVVKIATAEQIIENFQDKPAIEYGAYPSYKPQVDVVQIPHITDFQSAEDYHSTLFHELTHATGAEKRLKRKGIVNYDKFGSEQYAEEELVAELGASYLNSFAGIENRQEASASYIQGRLKALQNNKDMILKASGEAWKATEYILQGKKNLLDVFALQSEAENV